jgi:hypothetical protein
MSSNKLPSYGAVASRGSNDEEHAADQSFDAAHTYYLTDNTRWTMKKVLLIAVPILAAVMIVGGFAFFLLRDFSHLYPGRGGDKSEYYAHGGEKVVPSSSTTTGINSPITPASTAGDKSKSGSSKNNDIGATCGVHPDCAHLLGNCCPTSSGKMLDCCYN